MNKIICLCAVCLLLNIHTAEAQTRQQWRDSVEVLNRELRQHPDDVHLRLLKAEANVNLEEWDYALAEYGRILRADERNLAALTNGTSRRSSSGLTSTRSSATMPRRRPTTMPSSPSNPCISRPAWDWRTCCRRWARRRKS